MKQLLASGIAAVLLACAGGASANAAYTATLAFDAGLPALRTGTVLDGPHNLDGDWTTNGQRTVHLRTRDQIGTGPGGTPVWDDWRSAPGLHNVGGAPTTLGEIIAHQPTLGYFGSGQASVGFFNITSRGASEGGFAELDVAADWQRGFSLGAGEAMSFTSLCTLGILGDADPLAGSIGFSIDAAASFAKLTMADAANRVGASLSASLTSLFAGSLADVFSYTTGPDGRLVLTITNSTDAAMTGWLGAGTYVDVSAPIPEPLPLAMGVLGLALVGAAARRRARRPATIDPA